MLPVVDVFLRKKAAEGFRRGRFEAGISEVVLREISRAPEKKMQALGESKNTPGSPGREYHDGL